MPLCGSSPRVLSHSPPPRSSHPWPQEQLCRRGALPWCPASPPLAATGLPPCWAWSRGGGGHLSGCRANFELVGCLQGDGQPCRRLSPKTASWFPAWLAAGFGCSVEVGPRQERGADRACFRVQASAGWWLESVEPCMELPARCPRLSPVTWTWFAGTQAQRDLVSGSENCPI